MRRWVDRDGRAWDVMAGRESFGTVVALFVPGRDNDAPVRQAHLTVATPDEGNAQLDELTDPELGELLDRSTPKDDA